MGKKVKFSFDLVISDEKKEMATNETTNPQMLVERPDNITALVSLARARRKRKFILGLVIIGILLVGLGGYGIAHKGKTDKVIEAPPQVEGPTQEEQKPQIQEPMDDKIPTVEIIDTQDKGLLEGDMVELSDLVNGESSPCEGLSERINLFPTYPEIRNFIENGFYYELDKVVEDGIFKLEFVAATGVANNPQLLLNIYVDDEELVAQNDKIEVFAYCLDKETYDTSIRNYGQWNAYGVQDEYDSHLYHVTLPSGSFLAGETWVVFDMTKIRMGSRETEWKEFQVGLKEMIRVPRQIAFFPTCGIDTDGLEFVSDTKTYKLYWTEVAYDDTDLVFFFDYEDVYNENANGATEWEQFNDFIQEVTLEVNGVEYKVDPNARPYINMSDDRDNLYYYVYATFPGVKDLYIESVIVKYRDIAYRLR